ncbi:uncharacterized protein LOC129585632 [Paramacrobiotus metropolitanus]|uniref:uncharacterized protein LOC129585632 n=1 Tax=Paramacrobiotus metropolitanus TaxID=2943436 RepID=UPI002445A68C|nr:uncharacterized protein LOC129585632 [Paramacrobiotus metropolitanus]
MNRFVLLRLRIFARQVSVQGNSACPSCVQLRASGFREQACLLSTSATIAQQKLSPHAAPSGGSAASPATPPLKSAHNDHKEMDGLVRDLKAKASVGKLFYETENEGVRQALLRLPVYKEYFSSLPMKIGTRPLSLFASRELMRAAGTMKVRELIDTLSTFSGYLSLGRDQLVKDEQFLEFVKTLSRELSSYSGLTFPELQNLLQSYQRFRFDHLPHNFAPAGILRAALDAQCLEMWPSLKPSQAFILSDLWFLSSCSRLAEFPKVMLSRIKPQVDFFKPHELVRLLFSVSLQRTADPGLMLLIERMLLPHIQNFSIEEIAAVCAGFFKTQTTPGAELVDKILTRLLNMDGDILANDIVLTSCSKFADRYVVPAHHDHLKRLIEKVKPFTGQLSITTLAHLSRLLETISTVDTDFLSAVCHKLLTRFPNVRLKDVAKICQTCSLFNFRPNVGAEDFYTVVKELVAKNLQTAEISISPSKFVILLVSLARMEVFSKRLLWRITAPQFLKAYLGQPYSLLVNKEYLQLHYAVKIEFPEHDGPDLLPEELLRQFVADEISKTSEPHSAVSSLLLCLRTLLQQEKQEKIRGAVGVAWPLPYDKQMMLVRINDLRSMALPSELLSDESPHLLKEAPTDATCIALVYHPWWDYFNPGHELNGVGRMKLRHLRKLGYRPVSVDQQEIQNHNFLQKMKYLRDKLFFNDFEATVTPNVDVGSLADNGVAQANV